MKKLLALFFLLAAAPVFGQEKFEMTDASKLYDVKFEVERCEEDNCEGKITFSLFKKGAGKPFQIISLPETAFTLQEAKRARAKLMYDYQSVVFFEDYNFDGREDLALRDGNNGGYGGPSYQIYLLSPARGKFVYHANLTDLAQNGYLGMFEVDKKKRVLRASQKSGCCWHQTAEFQVVNNRLKKIYELTEDMTVEGGAEITTKRLVKGKWIIRVKREKRGD